MVDSQIDMAESLFLYLHHQWWFKSRFLSSSTIHQ